MSRRLMTVLGLLFSAMLLLTGSIGVFAQDSVTISADVILNGPKEEAIINLSQIDIQPPVVPVGGTALVTVTVRGENGEPLSGETVEMWFTAANPGSVSLIPTYLPTDAEGKTYASISSTFPQLVTVRAKVTTYDHDIIIADIGTVLFEPVPIPIMQAEPMYTQGNSNTVHWTGDPDVDMFQVEVATDVGFTDLVYQTAWLTENEYTFNNLEDGQIYYYRVRARNKYGIVGEWSNIVYSIQDASPPWSQIDSVEYVDGEFEINLQSEDAVSGVDFVKVYVSRDGGEWTLVGQTDNDLLTVELHSIFSSPFQWHGTFCFYSQAVDAVGNEEIFNPVVNEDTCIVVEEEEGEGTIIDDIEQIVEDVTEYVGYIWDSLNELIESFRGSGGEVPMALVSVSVGMSVISMISAIGLSLTDLPILLSELLVGIGSYLGIGGKRQPWGIVYDSVTKDQVSRSVVRLYQDQNLVQTVVTDPQGVFSFTLEKGEYTIDVHRTHYKFPSTVVVSDVDGTKKNIYRGGVIKVRNDYDELDINIPIDPLKVSVWTRFVNMLSNFAISLVIFITPIVMIVGTLFAVLCYLLLREPLYIGVIIANVVLLVWNVYSRTRSYDKWGVVLDEKGKGLPGVEIGIYDVTYGNLIDSRITAEDGKYHFVVPGEQYHLRPVSREYIVADGDPEKGYLVGRESKDAIIIAEKIVLRKSAGRP